MSKEFTCIEKDCGKKYSLTDSEMDFFTRIIYDKDTGEEIQMKPPKRCPECREKKKKAKNKL